MKRFLFFLCLVALVSGCRGWRSEKPPVHLNPNLDFNASIRAQESPAKHPDNIVPWGGESSFYDSSDRDKFFKSNNPEFYLGKTRSGNWVDRPPLSVNYKMVKRGQERFDIYCSMCHGKDGSGNGIVMDYGWFKPQPYWADYIVDYKDGEIFNIISNGIRTMSGYSKQIPEDDRWAIVTYIRALQVANQMPIQEVPSELKEKLK